jgi:20S proteasome alpha/beta subunit
MTVCIAAVCEKGQKIVIAADRMLTYPHPTSLEFETEESKIEEIASNCVALISGSSAYGSEILTNSRHILGGNPTPDINHVSETVKIQYTNTRMAKIDETIIFPALGGDYAKFLLKGGSLPTYLQVQGQIYQQLFMVSQQFNLGVDIIVSGIDTTGAHVSVITHPGTLVRINKPGYASIGSGAIHATIYLSLSGQSGQRSFYETLYNVYSAKKASEAAPGVGQATDLVVIQSGQILHCGQTIIEKLHKLFVETTKKQPPAFDELKEVYNEQCKS